MGITLQIVNETNGEVLYESSAESEEGYWCEECAGVVEADPDDPSYECGSCGEVFLRSESENGNHVCPSCGKFASKLANIACPECKNEVRLAEVVPCPACNEPYRMEDLGDHYGGCSG